jgi:hypothetical protein
MPLSNNAVKAIQDSIGTNPISAEEFVLREVAEIINGYRSARQQRVEAVTSAEEEAYKRQVTERKLGMEERRVAAAEERAGKPEAGRVPPAGYINKINAVRNALEGGSYVEKNFLGQTVGSFKVEDPEGLQKVQSREDFNIAWHANHNPYPEIRDQARQLMQLAAEKFTKAQKGKVKDKKADIFNRALKKKKGKKQ